MTDADEVKSAARLLASGLLSMDKKHSADVINRYVSAVKNVLALCNRAETHDFEGHPVVYADSIRKAITDALGATDE